jgi:hypothetical protein
MKATIGIIFAVTIGSFVIGNLSSLFGSIQASLNAAL